jgi:hypothetical protein
MMDHLRLWRQLESALRGTLEGFRHGGKADSLFYAMADLKIREIGNEVTGLVDVFQALANGQSATNQEGD